MPGVFKDLEWMRGGADYIGMPRIHAPYCQVWFLNIHKDEGVSWFLAAEGNEGDVIDKCDSRCSQVPWIDVRVVSSGLSHPLQFVQQYWYIGLHSLLFRRSMLRVVFNF